MPFEEIIAAILSALVAAIVPRIIKQAEEGIASMDSLPWLGWSIAGFIGGAVGGAASGLLGMTGLGLGGFGNWAIFGAALGLAQYFVLGNKRPVSAWYPLASTIGLMTARVGEIIGGLAGAFIIAGIMVGLLQFFSLNKFAGAGWWIFGNIIAWPIAGAISFFIGVALEPAIGFELAWVVSWGVVGLIGALILLIPMTRLKRK